jgi:exodeoxyribonuclease VII small subunit
MMSNKKTEIDFESAMERLDKITEELSKEGVSLENALALYEEGVGLVRACNKKLEQTDRRIKILQLSGDGELVEKDFAAENND